MERIAILSPSLGSRLEMITPPLFPIGRKSEIKEMSSALLKTIIQSGPALSLNYCLTAGTTLSGEVLMPNVVASC